MGLKMKNVNIMGVYQFLGEGGGHKKYIYGELPKKGGTWTICWGLTKNREGVFEKGELIPRCTL